MIAPRLPHAAAPWRFHAHLLDLWEEADPELVGGRDWDELALDALGLADPDRSRWQHMTGQSGHPGSRHYDDLLADWHAGRTNPVRQPPVDTLRLEPT